MVTQDLTGKYTIEPKFYNYVQNKATQVVPDAVEKPKISFDEFKQAMEEYANNLEGDHDKIYRQARLSARTTKSNRDSNHYMAIFLTFFFHSLEKTYPEKREEINRLQIKFEELKKELYKITRGSTLQDNELFISALFGITEGLL